jgi:anti-sigma regulatory factor (Ser/Thr protein kinase)
MRLEWGYPPKDQSAAAARRDVARSLRQAGVDSHLSDDVQLVVSELAANAVRHAATVFTVAVAIGAERVRVEVSDADSRPPTLFEAGPNATSGRGLLIVGAVAATWGYDTAERDGLRGKTVWAEFERTTPAATSSEPPPAVHEHDSAPVVRLPTRPGS